MTVGLHRPDWHFSLKCRPLQSAARSACPIRCSLPPPTATVRAKILLRANSALSSLHACHEECRRPTWLVSSCPSTWSSCIIFLVVCSLPLVSYSATQAAIICCVRCFFSAPNLGSCSVDHHQMLIDACSMVTRIYTRNTLYCDHAI